MDSILVKRIEYFSEGSSLQEAQNNLISKLNKDVSSINETTGKADAVIYEHKRFDPSYGDKVIVGGSFSVLSLGDSKINSVKFY